MRRSGSPGSRHRPRIACIGNFVIDTVVRPVDGVPPRGELSLVDSIDVSGGGAGFATSVALARLGADVHAVGVVGADDDGERIRTWLEAESVDHGAVVTIPMPTSATVCLVASDGERTYLHRVGASAELRVDPRIVEMPDLDWIHVGAALILERLDMNDDLVRLLETARGRGIGTSLDTSFDSTGRWERALRYLPHLDVFAPSLVEAQRITNEASAEAAARSIRRRGAGAAVIHAGRRGAFVDSPEYTGWIAASDVEVVDTTGAGECFDAGLVFALCLGRPIEDAVRFGCRTGALAVTAPGAVGGLTSLEAALEGWESSGPQATPGPGTADPVVD